MTLRDTIIDWYGQQNEIRAGIKPTAQDIIEKPEALMYFEMVESTGLPLVCTPPFGPDVMGQPHIWIMEYDICKQSIFLMQELSKQQNS